MPLWMCTLGVYLLRPIFPNYTATVPWVILVVLGLMYSVPAVIGNLIRRCVSEQTAVVTSLVFRVIGLLMVVTGAIIVFYSNAWAFSYISGDWRLVIAVCIYRFVNLRRLAAYDYVYFNHRGPKGFMHKRSIHTT